MFLDSFLNTQISYFMKILPVVAELFHADRRTQTDTTKLTVTFSNFANSPKTNYPSHTDGRSESHCCSYHESQNVFSKPIFFRTNSKSRCLRTFRSPATQHPDRPEHGLQRDPQACTDFVPAILMSLARWATV